MSDKERNIPSGDNESFNEGFRIEGVGSGEIDIAGAEGSKDNGSAGQVREHASSTLASRPGKAEASSLEEGQGDLLVDSKRQESAESRSSLVAELASHLSKPRSDFHGSAQFIGRCRKRYRDARF